MFEELAAAIADLDIPVEPDSLVAAIALRDRLDARIAEAAGAFEVQGWWGHDASASMTAWLRSHGRMTARAAKRLRCDRPSTWCEGHHVVWVTRAGPTELADLVLVCARHHHVLHQPGWHAKLLPDGLLEVTAPNGQVRGTSPPRAEVPW